MRVLSVDLAHSSYGNLGIVLLDQQCDGFLAHTLQPGDLGLRGEPAPRALAVALDDIYRSLGAAALLLDGPQGWKHPGNGLEHSRLCERELNTPGKTGLPGSVKPKNYLPFICFSIGVFEALIASGFELWAQRPARRLLVESFPLSAWRTLKLTPLPAKARAKPQDLARAATDLRRLFPLKFDSGLTHDELQALVAALAGVPLVRDCPAGYTVTGSLPTVVDHLWREGFIINPTREALRPCA